MWVDAPRADRHRHASGHLRCAVSMARFVLCGEWNSLGELVVHGDKLCVAVRSIGMDVVAVARSESELIHVTDAKKE